MVREICCKYNIPYFNPYERLKQKYPEMPDEYFFLSESPLAHYSKNGEGAILPIYNEEILKSFTNISSIPASVSEIIKAKTIIQVFVVQQIYIGLGDLIRGTIMLFNLCHTHGYQFIVDVHLHPISKFLQINIDQNVVDLVNHNMDKILFYQIDKMDIENTIINNHNPIQIFMTNGNFGIHTKINDEVNVFINKLLSPNPEMEKYLQDICYHLPEKYQILHFRFGDQIAFDKITTKCEDLVNLVIKYYNRLNNSDNSIPILVCCDSEYIKTLLPKNIKVILGKTAHLGMNNDMDSIRDTLIEFWVISKSCYIRTYSIYSWVSGFVYWIAKCNNIPVESASIIT